MCFFHSASNCLPTSALKMAVKLAVRASVLPPRAAAAPLNSSPRPPSAWPTGGLRERSDATRGVAVGRSRREALAAAYRRHAGAVFALSRRLLVDRAMAEEVVQEVFLRLWHQPDKFDPERGSLRSFLLA